MAARPPAKVLSVDRVRGEGAVYLRLTGVINETFEPARLGELSDTVVLDLSGVRSITSFGVRRWCDFMAQVPQSTRMYLVDCPPCVVDQINLVLNFCGRAEVISARAPYFCPTCDKDTEVRFDLLTQQDIARTAQLPPQPCPTCGTEMESESEYFRFAPRHAAKSLERSAARILGQLGVYSGHSSESRPLEVRKLVEGSWTLIRMSGTVDGKVRPRRLLEGVEGNVVLLLGGADGADNAAPVWNELASILGKQASEAVLVDVPYSLVELADRKQVDLGARIIVHSVQLPFFCATCVDIQSHPVPLRNVQRLVQSGGPCQRCGRETTPIEGMVSLESLSRHARPTPAQAQSLIDRANELFSTAHVEAAVTAEATVTAEPDSMAGKSYVGDYKIIRPLSAGGMAQVFLASRSSLGGFEKPVALKLFRRSLIEKSRTSLGMFLKEAKICARLSHPNIVSTFDVGEAGGALYMAMEYIDGPDLIGLLDHNKGPLPVPMVLHIAEKVLEALDYAHNAKDLTGTPLKIVHRDVSLRNVLVTFDGFVKLIDFGVALAGDQRRSSEVAGNVCYMSPEQCSGKPLDGRSDLFSLGVAVWEMLSGQYLFRRATIEQTLGAMLTADIPTLGVHPALEAVVRRALERNVDRRWQSAREMVEALREAAQSCGPAADTHELAAFVRQLFPDQAPEAPRNEVRSVSEQFAVTVPHVSADPEPPTPTGRQAIIDPSARPQPPSQRTPIIDAVPAPRKESPPPATGPRPSTWTWVAAVLACVLLMGGAVAWLLTH